METSDQLMLLARVAAGLGDKGVEGYEIPAERLGVFLAGEEDEEQELAGPGRAAQIAEMAKALGGEVS